MARSTSSRVHSSGSKGRADTRGGRRAAGSEAGLARVLGLQGTALGHTVVPRPELGRYDVTSGRSGVTYPVTPTGGERGVCPCERGVNGGNAPGAKQCTHIQAVVAFVRAELGL